MTRFKLGVVLEPFAQPLRVAVHSAARLGVTGVQVDAAGDLSPEKLSSTGHRSFRSLLKGVGLELAALQCPLRRGLDSAEGQQQRVEHVRKVMQLASNLGTRIVVTPLPRLPAEADTHRDSILRQSLTDLGHFGDRIGVQLALEAGLDPGERTTAYINTFDSGGLALAFDPANFLLNNHDPLACLNAIGGRVVFSHARDGRAATASGAGLEVPVGAGDVEWMTLVATLDSIGYRGYLCVDRETGTTRAADVTSGVNFLKRFVVA